MDLFESALPDILMLEFSTPRAGELSSLLESEILRQKCILGLGVINPRSDEVETVTQIVQRAEKSLKLPSTRANIKISDKKNCPIKGQSYQRSKVTYSFKQRLNMLVNEVSQLSFW